MRGLYMFIAGILVAVATQFAIAQSQNEGVVRMNHVGISSPNIEEAIEYYTETLGFPEAFRVTNGASPRHASLAGLVCCSHHVHAQLRSLAVRVRPRRHASDALRVRVAAGRSHARACAWVATLRGDRGPADVRCHRVHARRLWERPIAAVERLCAGDCGRGRGWRC